jgi:plastocyanin
VVAIASVTCLVAGIAACSIDGQAQDFTLVEGESVRVSAIDNFFLAETVIVRAGTEVLWTNDGRNDHDVVPVDSEGWGIALSEFPPGANYRHRFVEPGTFRYYCSIHGTAERGMIGTIEVTTE